MCTGRLPFESEETMALIRMIFKEAPQPPSVFYPAIPKKLEEAILRCLAKSPAERFQGARAFAEALEAVLAGQKAADAEAKARADGARQAARTEVGAPRAEAPRPRLGPTIGAIAAAGGGMAAVLAAAGIFYLARENASLFLLGFGVLIVGTLVWAAGTAALAVTLTGLLQREPAPRAAPAPREPQPPQPAAAPQQAAAPGAAPFSYAPGFPMTPESAGAAPRPSGSKPTSATTAWRYAPFDRVAAAQQEGAANAEPVAAVGTPAPAEPPPGPSATQKVEKVKRQR